MCTLYNTIFTTILIFMAVSQFMICLLQIHFFATYQIWKTVLVVFFEIWNMHQGVHNFISWRDMNCFMFQVHIIYIIASTGFWLKHNANSVNFNLLCELLSFKFILMPKVAAALISLLLQCTQEGLTRRFRYKYFPAKCFQIGLM